VQFVRAFSTTVVSPFIGLIADLTEGYRAGSSVCVALALIGIVTVLMTRGADPPAPVAGPEGLAG